MITQHIVQANNFNPVSMLMHAEMLVSKNRAVMASLQYPSTWSHTAKSKATPYPTVVTQGLSLDAKTKSQTMKGRFTHSMTAKTHQKNAALPLSISFKFFYIENQIKLFF